MKEVLEKAWQVFFALVVLAGFGAAGYYLIAATIDALASVSDEMAAGLLTAATTITAAVVTVVVGKQLEQRRAIADQHRVRKTEVYENFMKIWFEFLSANKGTSKKKGGRQPDIGKHLVDFTGRLILWGNPRVITEFRRFRSAAVEDEDQDPDPIILAYFEQVMFAMRKDLGHKDTHLKPGDLLLLFLNNPAPLVQQVIDRANLEDFEGADAG